MALLFFIIYTFRNMNTLSFGELFEFCEDDDDSDALFFDFNSFIPDFSSSLPSFSSTFPRSHDNTSPCLSSSSSFPSTAVFKCPPFQNTLSITDFFPSLFNSKSPQHKPDHYTLSPSANSPQISATQMKKEETPSCAPPSRQPVIQNTKLKCEQNTFDYTLVCTVTLLLFPQSFYLNFFPFMYSHFHCSFTRLHEATDGPFHTSLTMDPGLSSSAFRIDPYFILSHPLSFLPSHAPHPSCISFFFILHHFH